MGKLVRDKIPDLIRADGGDPCIRILGEQECRSALVSVHATSDYTLVG